LKAEDEAIEVEGRTTIQTNITLMKKFFKLVHYV